jgi:hypothetical protein
MESRHFAGFFTRFPEIRPEYIPEQRARCYDDDWFAQQRVIGNGYSRLVQEQVIAI